jgi:rhodanese-related sulfurtransferase
MKKLITILSVVMLLFVTACNQDQTKGEIKLVTAEEMHTLIEQKDVQLVDVRTPEEYKSGYINHSQNIDFNSPTFDEDVLKLDKNKPVLLYCRSGGRSAKCAEKLKAAGFVKIFDLEGGITKWKFDGFEIETN